MNKMDKIKCLLSRRHEGGKCHGSLCGFWSISKERCGIGVLADANIAILKTMDKPLKIEEIMKEEINGES